MKLNIFALLRASCLLFGAAVLFGFSGAILAAEKPSVKVWEQQVTLPTYQIGAPLTTPMFYHGRAYQGAQGHFYPYPVQDKLTYVIKDQNYKMLYLENQYVKIGVLPEIGGRVFYALDKTNNYKFLYSASVVKPGLVGMLGAWLDGGIEWNVPHHHRPSVYLPVQYKLEENPDGSKTIWVGELEINHRMRWLIGLTLHPDKSYVEGTFRLINQAPVANTFLYFANFGVHASPDYRVMFPPSTEVGTYHSKTDFIRWPIADGHYQGIDFTGEDVSLWKTHILMNSIFAHDCTEDWFGGYDHGKKAGVLYVADHHVSPGKKFWTWGAGEEGQMWDKLLTEPADGPVMELMAGSYSDNEPDYSWIQPSEVKTVKQYWYPFQQIGIVKNANLNAAVNLEVNAKGIASIGVQPTSAYQSVRVLLDARGKALLEKTVAIDPGKPFLAQVTLPEGTKESDLKLSVFNGTDELISYQPYQRKNLPLPKPAQPPPAPGKIASNEEAYLAGLRLEQFFNPAAQPYPWFEEVLKRDPGDDRVNTELGILDYKRGMFQEAEERLTAAANRVTYNYTRPKDGAPLYYLGLVQKARGKFDAAYETLYAATWSFAWSAPSYYSLAELASMKREPAKALEFLNKSLSTNSSNTKALDLKACLLRKSGRETEAGAVSTAALAVDPLDVWAQREQSLARGQKRQIFLSPGLWNDDVQPYLEMAVNLAGAGMWEEGISALNELLDAHSDKSRVNPMVYYWLGYLNEKAGKDNDAAKSYELARQMPSDYCFPFRVESIAVLKHVMERNPKDARAPFYLGNLLYDGQPKVATKYWETARDLDPKLPMVHRNLADAYAWSEQNYPKAVQSQETAVALSPLPIFLAELDQLYELAGVAPAKRLQTLVQNQQAVLQRDDALSREIRLYIELGKYDKALELLLNGHHYTVWEGGRQYPAHSSYQSAMLLSGHEAVRAKNDKEALKKYQAALEYPDNFSEGRPIDGGRAPVIYYFIGTTYEALGDAANARTYFEKAATVPSTKYRRSWEAEDFWPGILYYRACADRKLGRTSEADKIFESLVKSGEEALSNAGATQPDYFAKFGERESEAIRLAQGHYVLGLGYLGLGKWQEALTHLEEAVKLNVNHLEAQVQLASLKNPAI
jgi:tetratricopeptide (TPR) repeat protein